MSLFETTPEERYDLANVFAPSIAGNIGRSLTAQEMAALAQGVADITPKYRPSPIATGLIAGVVLGLVAAVSKETRKDAVQYGLAGGASMLMLSLWLDSSKEEGYRFGFERGLLSQRP